MRKMITALSALMLFTTVGCAGPRPQYRQSQYYGYSSRPVYSVRTTSPVVVGDKAVIGTLIGAGIGAAADDSRGALIGGVIGLLAGSGMDQREAAYQYNQPYYGGRSYNRYYAPQYRPQPQPTLVRVVRCYNSNGTMFEVRLRHLGDDQWQGPRGEIYHRMPSGEILRQRYAGAYRY